MSKNSAQKKKQPKTVVASTSDPMDQTTEILPTSEPSYQDYPESSGQNVSKAERIVSGLAGGGLLFYGIPNLLTIPGQLSSVTGAYLLTRGVVGYCPLYAAFGIDSTPNGRLHHRGLTDPHPLQLRQTISIARSPREVYEFCRDQSQVSRCFPTVKQVQKIDEHHSIWMFSDSAELVSFPVSVETSHEEAGEQLSWAAFPDSRFRINGTLQFKAGPHEQETELIAMIHMIPPAGVFGASLMKWFSPITEQALDEVLHHMKQVIETGFISTSESQIPHRSRNPLSGWQNRMKSHLHIRTMQSLANRRIS